MNIPISSEMLFQGGITLMAAAVILMLVSFAIFFVSGRKLKKQLEEEYGKIRK